MNIKTAIAAVALGLGVAATAAAQEAPSILKDIVKAAIEGYIRPAVTDLKKSTATLSQSAGALCRTRDSQALADTRAALAVVVSNWMGVEFLRFGPLSEQNRAERFLFWPDPRGTGLRQVQRALSTREPSLTNASDLSNKSVALQGLTTLEFLLHGTGADALAADTPEGTFRCEFAQAVAANLKTIAVQTSQEWHAPTGISSLLLTPGADNSRYRTHAEAGAEIIKALTVGLQMLSDQKLSPALAKPRRALLKRSALTLPALEAQLSGIAGLFQAAGLTELATARTVGIGDSALFEFDNARRALVAAGPDFATATADEQRRSQLEYTLVVINGLRLLIAEELAPALGVELGFNAFDGD